MGLKKSTSKDFKDFTIAELRMVVEQEKAAKEKRSTHTGDAPVVISHPEMDVLVSDLNALENDLAWTNGIHILDDEVLGQEQATEELLNLSWKSELEQYEGSRWVRVESVIDSGASAPVAPPSMMPNVKVLPSEGSRRGQKWSSASKHKIRNWREQHLKACTEDGDHTDALFQIADVSKPLVSVSAICERGNRVIFGRNGGAIQNLRTNKLIPFHRRNGIYILSLWLEDNNEADFQRP